MGEALAVLALVLFSTNVLVVKVATSRLPRQLGFFLALGSNVVFGAVLAVVQVTGRDRSFEPQWEAFALFALAGVFATYLGRRLFFRSVEMIGPSRAASLQILNPVLAVVLGWALLDEVLRPLDLVAMGMVLLGLWLTTVVPVAGTEAGQGGLPLRQGALLSVREVGLALLSALGYALGNVVRGVGVRRWDEPALGGLVGAVTAVAVYLVAHVDVRSFWSEVRASNRFGLALWALSGMLTISAQISVIAATRHISVGVAVVISTALPVLVIPASLVLFGNTEGITVKTVSGAGLLLVGVAALILT